MDKDRINIKNRRATYDFEILEKFTAGMKLQGTEIKSIREGKASINEAFCVFHKDELWIRGMHIAEYTLGTYANHDPIRERKLLLKKRELKRLQTKVTEKGLTIIPLRVFISDRGFAKMDIGLAKGKKTHDKRHSIKDKDLKRDLDREMRIR